MGGHPFEKCLSWKWHTCNNTIVLKYNKYTYKYDCAPFWEFNDEMNRGLVNI